MGSSTRNTLNIQGTVQSTGVSTNLAISGNGYFIVRENNGTTDSPDFTGETGYTRRGDFAPDASGYLTNGAGYYLFAGPFGDDPRSKSRPAPTPCRVYAVSPAGTLTGTAADGSPVALGSLTLAQFGPAGQSDLPRRRDLRGQWPVRHAELRPQRRDPHARLGGAIERPAISDEFSKMIETQQAYTANTKVMSTTDQMLQDAIAMYT